MPLAAPATTWISTLSLHDALPICGAGRAADLVTKAPPRPADPVSGKFYVWLDGSYQSQNLPQVEDRKSTRLNSSHPSISYAVFCLKKKNQLQAAPDQLDHDM